MTKEKRFELGKKETLRFVAATLTASAVAVSAIPASADVGEEVVTDELAVGSNDVTPVNEGTTTTSADSANVAPSYNRTDAYNAQNEVASADDVDDFVQHVADNTNAQQVDSFEDLANVLSEGIKNNQGAIVIEDTTNIIGQIDDNGDDLIKEIGKTGTNAGALATGYSLQVTTNAEGKEVYVVMPFYEETNGLSEVKNAYVDQVVDFVNTKYANATDIEKLYGIYSYLGETTVYGTDSSLPASSPSSLILDNKAVCEAFAYLYQEIANKIGFEMEYVTGEVKQGSSVVGHAWNLVKVDGEWYNSDATFGNIDHKDGTNSLAVNINYFLFSDAKAANTHTRSESAYATDALPVADSERFDEVFSDTPQFAYGGGVKDNLIISPKSNEVVIFDTTTNLATTVAIDLASNDTLNSTALVDGVLYATYTTGLGAVLVAQIDLTTGEVVALEDGGYDASKVKYSADGIYVNDTLLTAYHENASVNSNEFKPSVTVGNDQNFALQTLYEQFIETHDTELVGTIDAIYTTILDESTDLEATVNELSSKVNELKDVNVRNEQLAKLANYDSYLSVVKGLSSFTQSTDSQTEQNLLTLANSITDGALVQKAIELINAHKAQLIANETPVDNGNDGETGDNDNVPTEPTPTPTEPTNPPVDNGNGENDGETGDNGNVPTEPTPTPTEPTNPPVVVPPTTDNGNVGNVVVPSPVNPVLPPVVENGNTNTGNDTTNPVAPPTQEQETGNTDNDTTETDVTTSPSLSLDDIGIVLPSNLEGTTAVQLLINENNEIVITSDVLANNYAVTITIPVQTEGKVLKLRTANGLETVAYTIVNGEYVVQLHKTGTLVFVDASVNLKDIENNTFKDNITKLAERGIITGNENGEYNPNAKITRAQFAALLARGLGFTEQSATFNDVNTNEWYAGYVGALSNLGIINGDNGNFNGSNTITRQQLFAMAGRVLEQHGFELPTDAEALAKFNDNGQVAEYAQPYLALLVELGIVSGSNGDLNPQAEITKGQVAKIVALTLEKIGKL